MLTKTPATLFNMFPIYESEYGEKLIRLTAMDLIFIDEETEQVLKEHTETERTYPKQKGVMFKAVWYNLGYSI